MVDVILGLQFGDECKAKATDFLSCNYDVVAKANGGPNAGNTLYTSQGKLVLHVIPSGIIGCPLNYIGPGVVIDPIGFKAEGLDVEKHNPFWKKALLVAEEASLILPVNKELDLIYDKIIGIGTTKKGIGPTYADLALRTGFMVRDIKKPNFRDRVEKYTRFMESAFDFSVNNEEFFEATDFMAKNISFVPGIHFIQDQIKTGAKILVQGGQGVLLHNRFGTYPYVTSSLCGIDGVIAGLGINHNQIGEVYGILKAYSTRVGNGPAPGELDNEIGKKIQEIGQEFGATTGRARRPGWLDLVALKYAVHLSGATKLILAKADVFDDPFFENVSICNSYTLPDGKIVDKFISDPEILSQVKTNLVDFPAWKNLSRIFGSRKNLPKEFADFVDYIEKEVGVPISMVSNGAKRESMIIL